MKVSVQINYKQMENLFEKAIDDALTELAPILEKYAQKNHQYINRTGNLSKSIIGNAIKNSLTLDAGMEYASYVHNWDPWLDDTMKINEKIIMKTLDKHIKIACGIINK